jgi:hypothetical protein
MIAVTLAVKLQTKVSTEDYPEKPADETWYQIITTLDLRMTVEDPNDDDGITNYIVSSERIFVCRPDPEADSLWVVFREIERPFVN